ncbi:CHAT domain-containing protein [Saccharothrix syringae]|uniref:CHAT domain-containing protein n=1 Tax=Saccharothrix syringae TaxID=103733 RepID=UPI000A7D6B1B|nr:CHAT domain-containing protein [Saccharothrix syringae]
MSESDHVNQSRGAGGPFVQARDVAGGIHFHSPPTARPRQLPPPIGEFTGRRAQLAELDALLDAPAAGGVVVSAVSGTAGVGKTALAIHWAHRVRALFPDGQLYADLRGYDREPPLPPGDVLAGFLRALGDTEVPDDLAERAARYRSLVADRRVLVVLDNARTDGQVQPLLPGSPTCFVVVTSRDRLPSLRVRYGAHGVDLDLLPLDDALSLLRATVGTRVDQDPDAAAALVRRCAHLPLALRITAELAATRPRAPLRELADELAEEGRLLGVAEDDRTIRTVFSWSVRQLDDEPRRVFRLLGLHPGRDYDAAAVAVLAEVDEGRARRAMDALARAHLVAERADRRYLMHDLLAAYARELAGGVDDDAVFRRLFRHYSEAAQRAVRAGDLTWFEAERFNLEVLAGNRRAPTAWHVHFVHSLAVLHRLAGDIPRALRHFQNARHVVERTPHRRREVMLDQAEALVVAGLYSEASLLLDELHECHGTSAELHRLGAIAALGSGDFDTAARWALAAAGAHGAAGHHREAASCALTRLAAVTAEPARAPRSALRDAMSTAAELKRHGAADEAGHALLIAARLLVTAGEAERATALLDEDDLDDPSAEHELLRRLCRAELALHRGDADGVLAHTEAAFTAAIERTAKCPARLTPAPMSTFYAQRLRELALRVVIGRPDPRPLFDFAERARVRHLKYLPHPLVTDSGVVEFDAVTRMIGNRALVSFVRVWNELFALVVAHGSLAVVELGHTDAVFELARTLRADIDAAAPDHLPAPLVRVIRASTERNAAELDRLVMRPLAPHIGDLELVIVPTGPLYSVAWAALPSLRGRPIVVAPSVTAWSTAETRLCAKFIGPRRTVFVLGPGMVVPHGELVTAAAFHPHAMIISGAEAKVETALDAIDGAGLVHLAAHGENEADNSSFSRLELADGPLFAHQFGELRKPPGQVILAACELALSRKAADDDALGFANGLLAAGAATVIAAVSRVGDDSAADAMYDYHRGLSTGKTPAQALAQAVAVDPVRRPFICIGTGEG